MPHVTLEEVQQWLEQSKFGVDAIDVELEATAWQMVVSRLQGLYSTSTWSDATSTPRLVRNVISMLIAAWQWQRQNPQASSESGADYGSKLEARAMMLLDGIVSGLFEIPGSTIESDEQPVFFPTDAATELAKTDPDAEGAAPMYFTMGQVF